MVVVEHTHTSRGLAVGLAAGAFEALPSAAAVVAPDGEVLAVNEAWRAFGRANGGCDAACGVGSNYLQACATARASGDTIAGVAETALRALLDGHAPRAAMEYPCHSPTVRRWFHLRAQHLPGRLEAVVVHDEISAHVLENERLRESSAHDPLTGLGNQTLARDRLGSALSLTDRRREATVAVVLVDLDGFSLVNRTYGRPVGDALLAAVAQRLESLGRSWDTIARWADDRFVLVLPGCTQDAAERIRGEAEALVAAPVELGVLTVQVSASTGVAVAGRGQDLAEVLETAEWSLATSRQRRHEAPSGER